MLGGSVGTSPLNTIRASASPRTSPRTSPWPAHRPPGLTGLTLAHGYDTAFWWTAGIFAQAHGKVPTAQATAGPARPA